jgi:hypothetical protein
VVYVRGHSPGTACGEDGGKLMPPRKIVQFVQLGCQRLYTLSEFQRFPILGQFSTIDIPETDSVFHDLNLGYPMDLY